MDPTASKKKSPPTMAKMIKEAIETVGKHMKGASRPAVQKYLVAKYGATLGPRFDSHLRMMLKRLIGEGKLAQVKRSYRVTSYWTRFEKNKLKKARKKKSKKSKKPKKAAKSPKKAAKSPKKAAKSPKKAKKAQPKKTTVAKPTKKAPAKPAAAKPPKPAKRAAKPAAAPKRSSSATGTATATAAEEAAKAPPKRAPPKKRGASAVDTSSPSDSPAPPAKRAAPKQRGVAAAETSSDSPGAPQATSKAPQFAFDKAKTPKHSTWKYAYKWQYHDAKKGGGPWHDYDAGASDVVEEAYTTWMANPATDVSKIFSGEWHYMVDFNSMQQTNLDYQSHTVRKIRRVKL